MEAPSKSPIVESSVQASRVMGSIGLSGLRSCGGTLCSIFSGPQVCACVNHLVRQLGQALPGAAQHAGL
jgi:hypothetical protein